MIRDPIVEDIHQIREKLSQKFQYDVRKIFDDTKQREIQHPEKLVNLQKITYKNRSVPDCD